MVGHACCVNTPQKLNQKFSPGSTSTNHNTFVLLCHNLATASLRLSIRWPCPTHGWKMNQFIHSICHLMMVAFTVFHFLLTIFIIANFEVTVLSNWLTPNQFKGWRDQGKMRQVLVRCNLKQNQETEIIFEMRRTPSCVMQQWMIKTPVLSSFLLHHFFFTLSTMFWCGIFPGVFQNCCVIIVPCKALSENNFKSSIWVSSSIFQQAWSKQLAHLPPKTFIVVQWDSAIIVVETGQTWVSFISLCSVLLAWPFLQNQPWPFMLNCTLCTLFFPWCENCWRALSVLSHCTTASKQLALGNHTGFFCSFIPLHDFTKQFANTIVRCAAQQNSGFPVN